MKYAWAAELLLVPCMRWAYHSQDAEIVYQACNVFWNFRAPSESHQTVLFGALARICEQCLAVLMTAEDVQPTPAIRAVCC